MTSLKKAAIRGTLWTLFSYGSSNVLRLGSNLVLTRLLFPDVFGLMALIGTLITGVVLFTDIGFGPNIIQNKRGDDPDFLNTAWTLALIRNTVIWIVCILLAVPAARFYNHPELVWLIPIASSGVLIAGFASTAVFTLSRHMDFRRFELFTLGEQICATTVTLLWAWISPSVLALAAGSLAGPIFRVIWSNFLVPVKRNRFAWDKDAVRDLFGFGKWIFFSTAATFMGGQADRLILGKLIAFSLLGVYGIALGFAELPRQVVDAVSNKVLLPIMAKVADLPRSDLRKTLLKHRRPILMGAALLISGMVCLGDAIIFLLYDSRYSQAAWMLPILVLGIWPNLLHESSRQSLMALGKPNYEAFGQFFKCITVIVGVPLGFHFLGILGAVIVVALNDLPLYGAISYGLCREGLTMIKQDVLMTGFLALILASLLTLRWALGFGFPIQTLFAT